MVSRRWLTLVPAVLLVASCSSGAEPSPKAAPTTHPTTARPPSGIQVLDPVFVMNDNGTATLSARILNHTDEAAAVSDAYFDSEVRPGLMFRFFRSATLAIPSKGEVRIGQEVPAKVRLSPDPTPGQTI